MPNADSIPLNNVTTYLRIVLQRRSGKDRILVLDDEKDIAITLRVALEQIGFDVDVFTDPRLALTKFSAGRYRLVISDIRMTLMSGLDFVRRIQPIDSDVKIVLMTAFDLDRNEFDEILPMTRVDALIRKPVTMSKLENAVISLVGASMKPRQ